MEVAVLVLLIALVVFTFQRLRRYPNQRTLDLETVRRTPVPNDVQLRAQAVDDEEGKRASIAEIRNCARLTQSQAEVAYELLRHGERLPEQ